MNYKDTEEYKEVMGRGKKRQERLDKVERFCLYLFLYFQWFLLFFLSTYLIIIKYFN